jgi:DnaJ homolog subfamily C member 19
MGTMTALLVLALLGVLLATLHARETPRAAGAAPKRSKGPSAVSPYWLLGALLIGVVLLRFGINWVVVAGGVLLAGLRSLVPVLRFLPLLQSLHRSAASARAGRSSAGSPGSAGGPGGAGGAGRTPRMTRQEALQVLGLDEQATQDDVQREYRRLMRKVHPDLGGSSYLAAKLNEAKDVLS